MGCEKMGRPNDSMDSSKNLHAFGDENFMTLKEIDFMISPACDLIHTD